jgi:hypothetical protein
MDRKPTSTFFESASRNVSRMRAKILSMNKWRKMMRNNGQ